MKASAVMVAVMLTAVLPVLSPSGDGAVRGPDRTSEYWDGSVYTYRTYGSGAPGDPYRSEITGCRMGDMTDIHVTSALEGHPLDSVGARAFDGCGRLRSVVIPAGVTSIGDRAFLSCTQLTAAYFLGPPPRFGADAFPSGTVFHVPDGMGWGSYSGNAVERLRTLTLDGMGFHIVNGEAALSSFSGTGDVTVPDQVVLDGSAYPVTSIGAGAFRDAREVSSVTLGSNVRVIEERAFYGCGLSRIRLDGVECINDEAFRECRDLLGDDGCLAVPGSVRYIGFEAFRMCDSVVYAEIPDSVEFLGDGALRASASLEEVRFGNIIKDLGPYSLDNCPMLKRVTFADGLESVGAHAFVNCGSLTLIHIPGTVRAIGAYAFSGCGSLDSVTLPASLESIGDRAFSRCTGLSSVTFKGPLPHMGMSVFAGTSGDLVIYYPQEYADSWKGYTDHRTVAVGPSGDGLAVYAAAALMSVAAAVSLAWYIRRR